MERFIQKPSIDMYAGIRVTKDTKLEYSNEHVEQKLENLVLQTVARIKGDNFKSTHYTFITLSEGDVLIFEDKGRGYIKPVEEFVTVAEAIDELSNIKDMR